MQKSTTHCQKKKSKRDVQSTDVIAAQVSTHPAPHSGSTSISNRSQIEPDHEDGTKVSERNPQTLNLLTRHGASGAPERAATSVLPGAQTQLDDAAGPSKQKARKTKNNKSKTSRSRSNLSQVQNDPAGSVAGDEASAIVVDPRSRLVELEIRVRVPGHSDSFTKPAPALISAREFEVAAAPTTPAEALFGKPNPKRNAHRPHTALRTMTRESSATPSRSISAPQHASPGSGSSSVASALTPVPSIGGHDRSRISSPIIGETSDEQAYEKMSYAQAPMFVPSPYGFAMSPAPYQQPPPVFYDHTGFPIYGLNPYVVAGPGLIQSPMYCHNSYVMHPEGQQMQSYQQSSDGMCPTPPFYTNPYYSGQAYNT